MSKPADGTVNIRLTLDDESLWLLDWHCSQAHITSKNRRSVMIQQLIHEPVKRIKIADRPVYPGREELPGQLKIDIDGGLTNE